MKTEWNKRIKVLKKCINKWIKFSQEDKIPNEPITTEYLYLEKK